MTGREVGEALQKTIIVLTFPISVPIMLVLALLKYLRKPD